MAPTTICSTAARPGALPDDPFVQLGPTQLGHGVRRQHHVWRRLAERRLSSPMATIRRSARLLRNRRVSAAARWSMRIPRIISNLIVDQTSNNPAAITGLRSPARRRQEPLHANSTSSAASSQAHASSVIGPSGAVLAADRRARSTSTRSRTSRPDIGDSAPYNSMFTLFGQFFDHGLDLVAKGGNGTVYIPLMPDDPLYNPATPHTNFMAMTRATRGRGRQCRRQHDDAVGRPEPDLHLASVAPGVPARIHDVRRRQAGRHRRPARRRARSCRPGPTSRHRPARCWAST